MTKDNLLNAKEHILFWKYVIPSVAGMVGMSLYIFADTFFIANGIGASGLTALNISLPIFGLISGVGLLIGVGGATSFSIAKGSKNIKKQNESFTLSFTLTLIIGISLTILGISFAREIAYMLGATETSINMVVTYIRTVFIFFWAFVLNHNISSFVRNDGAPKLAMYAMLISTIANIIFDYIFIFPLNLGIFGAALATGVSPIISLLILSLHIIKKKNTFKFTKVKLSFANLKWILSGGVTSFLTEFSMGLVIFIFNLFIIMYKGDLGVSAYAIITNFNYIAVAIFNGIGQGIQPIISVNYGAKENKRVLNILNLAIITSFVIGIITFLIGLIFPNALVSLFNNDGNLELQNIAVKAVRIYFLAFIFMGINMIMALFLQAITMAKKSAIISFLRGSILVITSLLILSYLFKIIGVWTAVPMAEFLTLLYSLKLYKIFKSKLNLSRC